MEQAREIPLAVHSFEEKSTSDSRQPPSSPDFAVIIDSVEKQARTNASRKLASFFQITEKEALAILTRPPIILLDHLLEQDALKVKNAVVGPGIRIFVTSVESQKKKCFKIVWPETSPNRNIKTSDPEQERNGKEETTSADIPAKRQEDSQKGLKTLVAAAPKSLSPSSPSVGNPADFEKITSELAETKTRLEQVLSASLETSGYWIRIKNETQIRIEQLEDGLRKKTAETEQMARQLLAGENECERLRQDLEEAHRQHEITQQEKQRLDGEQNNLRQQWEAATSRHHETSENLRKVAGQLQETEAQRDCLESELELLRQQSHESLEKLRLELDLREFDMTQWQNTLKCERDCAANLQIRLAETQTALDTQARDIAEERETWEKKLEEASKQTEAANRERQEAIREKDGLIEQLRNTESRLQETEDRLNSAAAQCREAENERTRLTAELESHHQQSQQVVEQMRLTIGGLEYDMTQWQDALKRERDHIANLQTQLADTQQQTADRELTVNSQRRELEEIRQATERERSEALQKIEAISGEIEAAKQEREQVIRERDAVLERFQESQKQLQDMTDQLQSVSEQYKQTEAERKRLETEIESLRQQPQPRTDEMQRKLEQQELEIAEWQEIVKREQSRLRELRAQFEKTQTKLEQKLTVATDEKIALKKQLQELETQVDHEITKQTQARQEQEALTVKLSQLESERETISQAHSGLKNKAESFQKTAEKAAAALEEQSRHQNHLKQEWEKALKEQGRHLEEEKKQHALAQERLARATSELDQWESKFHGFESKLRDFESALTAARQSETQWKSECGIWRDRHAALEQIKDSLIARLREEEQKYAEVISDLEKNRALQQAAGTESSSETPLPIQASLAADLTEQLRLEKLRFAELDQEYSEIKKRIESTSHPAQARRNDVAADSSEEMSMILALEDQQAETRKWKSKAEELDKQLAQISERLQFLK